MRRFRQFYRDRSGLAAPDFALLAALVFAARHLALSHGTDIGALLSPLFGG